MSRMDQLLELRRQVDAEIEREHTAIIRARELRKSAVVVLTRGSWNTRVFAAVCAHFAIDGDTVLGASRDRYATDARHVAMWLMRDAGRTYPEIGREMERDHTSVISACRRIERDPELLAVAAEIRLLLTGEPVDEEGAA